MIDSDQLKKQIYQTAFTHRSALNESSEKIESNERLEFLGDSILSFIISDLLFRFRPEDSEGEMTNLRSFIVKTQSLAKAARKLDLGKLLSMSKGEELSGGRDNPQLMANTYEALVGAIFIDQGIEATKQFIAESLLPLFEKEFKNGPPKDAKSDLQEILQEKYKKSPQYKLLKTIGPDHARTFEVGVFLENECLGKGSGLSKQVAEEASAKQALETLLDK